MRKKKNLNKHDSLRQILNLIFSFAQTISILFTPLTGIGVPIGSNNVNVMTPLIPAAYTFSIWGVIFLTSIIYGIYQYMPAQKENKLFRTIGFYTAASYIANTIWALAAQLVPFNWPTVIIIFFILYPSLKAFIIFSEYKNTITQKTKVITSIPVTLLAGWISAATFINISSSLKQLNYSPFNLSETALAFSILVLAGITTTTIILKTKGNYMYVLTLVWAFIGIMYTNLFIDLNTTIVVTITVLLSTISAITYISRKSTI